MPDLSLKLRLVITILVLALLSTFVISDRALILTKRQVSAEQATVLKHAATVIGASLFADLSTRAEQVEFFANLPLLRSGEMSPDERQELLRYIKTTNPNYAWVGLTNPQGVIVQDADNLLPGANVSKRSWFLQGSQGTAFGDAHQALLLEELLQGEDASEPLRFVDISTPVYSPTGELVYVLGVHLNLLWAQEIKLRMLTEIGDPDIEILVLDHKQQPIISNIERLDKQTDLLTNFTKSLPISDWKGQVQVIGWPRDRDYLTAAASSGAVINSPSLGWTVVARKPLDAVYKPADGFATDVFWFAAVIFLLFMVIVWFAIDRALRPLVSLAAIADKIRESDAHAQLPELKGNSEVARFARSLSQLVNELTDKNRELVLADRMFSDNRLATMVTDAKRNIIRINNAFTEFTGYTIEEVRGKKPSILSSGRHDKSFYDSMNIALKEQGRWRGEIWNRHKSGRIYPEYLTIITLTNTKKETTNFIGMFEDISEQKGRERSLDRLKNFDSLTNLPNREAGIRSLNAAIEESQRSDEPFAIIFIDISGFKTVNELMGHRVGDQLLRQVARRLMSIAVEQGFLARWGGDEFMLYASRCDRQIAKRISNQLLDAMTNPFHTQDEEHQLSINCGIALFPEHAKDTASLLRYADIAMLGAKKNRKEPVLFYTPEMNDQVVRHMEMESALRRAIESNFQGFELYYQPQFYGKNRVIKGYEALIRWNSLELGFVSPDQFIMLAESCGLIEPIGRWVMARACETLAQFNASSQHPLSMSINVSGMQLQDRKFVDQLVRCANEHDVAREQLIVEVTETAFMGSDSGANEVLEAVRGVGFGVSIDDFGTGYAGLDYIQRFKPTEIKIDRTFVDKMLTDPHCMNIVKFTSHLAQSMELELVAEGVETQEQLDALNDLGEIIAQGYLLGRPLPFKEAVQQLLSN